MSEEAASPKHLVVGVVGGGIVGLTFAAHLSQLGKCEVHLFEGAKAFAEVGAGIGLGYNALNVYDDMGMREDIKRIGNDMGGGSSNVWMDVVFGDGRHDMDPICTVRTPVPGGQAFLHRADLLDMLVARLPKHNVHLGKHLERYEDLQDGGAKLFFKDGSSYDVDVLVGADGIKSTVRRVMYGDQAKAIEPRWSGSTAYRGLIPMEKVVPVLGECRSKGSTFWFGHSQHIVQYPVSQDRTVNIAAFFSDFEHGRYPEWQGSQWLQPCQDNEEVLREFNSWIDPIKKMLHNLTKPTKWAIFELPKIPTFARGHCVLIGDSAHACAPHQGNGASQGIEDAHVLAALLSHPKVTKESVPLALKVYDEIRRPRAHKVQDTSYEAGLVYEGYSSLGDDEQKLAENMATRMDWIWTFDVRGQRDEAVQAFEEQLKNQGTE